MVGIGNVTRLSDGNSGRKGVFSRNLREKLSGSIGNAERIAPVDLARLAWLLTVIACLIAMLILGLQGYYGYAGVTLALAVSAAINLR